MNKILKFNNVSFTYKTGVRVFEDLSFEMEEGEFVYIIGPTGTGKSTLAKLITSQYIPNKGSIFFYNINVGKLTKRKIPAYRQQIGVAYQDFLLLDYKTCLENIEFVLELKDLRKAEKRKRARELLKLVGLSDKGNSYPKQLSGGQKQRLGIARAIAFSPKLLICDEPTASLDPEMANQIMDIIERINSEMGTAVIFITHNDKLVNERRHRTLLIGSGRIISDLKEGGYASDSHLSAIKRFSI